ncbi:Exocyst complex component Sec5, partial [Rhizoctonia solani]|uniref:Exocyst complex component SEC5 n=2 Tax=Rhizoctonia solani TaxID=456999 RepID=A0A8H7M1N2_9AGAM
MGNLNLSPDEASLLKAYRISSLNPRQETRALVPYFEIQLNRGALPDAPEFETDPLGLGVTIDLRDMDMESKALILLSSKSFDPKAFLTAVHPNATYQDLASAVNHLRTAIDSRSEAIRVLVEDNFDRFVAVKSNTDALYAEMKSGLLDGQNEFASKRLRETLKQASQKASQVFLPVLENDSKATKLRSTLNVFDRSKFFFNLPGSLAEQINAGRHDAALRDYKKGQFLIEGRLSTLFGLSGPAGSSNGSSATDAQQRRIADRVWAAVERVMGDMRAALMARLQDGEANVEEHEKTLEMLSELQIADDPVWMHLDSQHSHILAKMKTTHDKRVLFIEGGLIDARDRLPLDVAEQSRITANLFECVCALETKSAEATLSKGPTHEVWQATLDYVKSVSEITLGALPNFWRIGKAFLEGKFKKTSGASTVNLSTGTRRSPTQCRTMALDVVRQYISLISEYFKLSDMAVSTLSPVANGQVPSSFLPPGADSVSAAHWLQLILKEIVDCSREIGEMEIGGDASSMLKELIDGARWTFGDALCGLWVRDSKIFHTLETWVTDPSNRSTTFYLPRMHFFQKHNTTAAFKIAGGADLGSNSSDSKQRPVPTVFTSKISKTFLDSLYAFLDGLAHLASPEYSSIQSIRNEARGKSNSVAPVDLANVDVRILLVISNMGYLSLSLIPSMINQLEAAFGISIANERRTLMEVLSEIDKKLFDTFIKDKITHLTKIMRYGILESGLDWYETPRPTEVRAYIYEALTYLVQIHAQISEVARPVLDRTLNAIVDQIVQDALGFFRQVKRFGMGGMLRPNDYDPLLSPKACVLFSFMCTHLWPRPRPQMAQHPLSSSRAPHLTPSHLTRCTQATLEIEFFHQTLMRFCTPAALKTLTEIYETISRAYHRKPGQTEDLQQELDGVKKTLNDTRRATQIEFLCFKVPKKDKGESRKEREGTGDRTEKDRERGGSSRPPGERRRAAP